jgi:hypothetical protein
LAVTSSKKYTLNAFLIGIATGFIAWGIICAQFSDVQRAVGAGVLLFVSTFFGMAKYADESQPQSWLMRLESLFAWFGGIPAIAMFVLGSAYAYGIAELLKALYDAGFFDWLL